MIIITFGVTFQFYFQAIYTTFELYKPPYVCNRVAFTYLYVETPQNQILVCWQTLNCSLFLASWTQ